MLLNISLGGISPLLAAQLNAIGSPLIGPRLLLSPLETALLRPPGLGGPFPMGPPVPFGPGPLGTRDMAAATLGVDSTALDTAGSTDTSTGPQQGIQEW